MAHASSLQSANEALQSLAVRCELARGFAGLAKTARARRFFTNIAKEAHRDMMTLSPVSDDIASMDTDALLAELQS